MKLFLLGQSLLWSLVAADASNLNSKGDGCVDPSGYLKCYEDNINTLATCMDDAKKTCLDDEYSICVLACGNVQLAANIGCWLTSCWNEVYSCAYQETALQYLIGADRTQGSQIPYYPAPDNAPGGCGNIWGNFTETYALNAPCEDYALDGVLSEVASCQCCWDSSFLSEFIEWCPHNDLSFIAIDTMVETFQIGYNESASDQCSILSDPKECVASFSLDTGASTWYNPGDLPSGFPGTAPLSTTTDAGSLTSAPDPYTFSIFPSYITVITPVPYNKKNAEETGTGTAAQTEATGGTGTNGATGTDVGTGTATGKNAASTSSGAANNIVSPMSTTSGIWCLAIYTVVPALFGAMLIL
ncbi:hypothetical protein N7478_002029 [Penicillium angulare]|uniref:uncharacterized protein n=1 Tax=Penicillium angulare TaxID=116970 RepID=UPI00254135B4|nr:uncharacterized protein N7478_002029 [Penicillium angulare]KAJ5288999.1 hypothetical protein N7478_002029 [Penicillium angulare]